jgi:hypothetical protein
MLNVDQHNPQVKKRMTKPEFLRNNRGINSGADLPESILTDIFDEIATNELRLKDDDDKPVDMTGGCGGGGGSSVDPHWQHRLISEGGVFQRWHRARIRRRLFCSSPTTF